MADIDKEGKSERAMSTDLPVLKCPPVHVSLSDLYLDMREHLQPVPLQLAGSGPTACATSHVAMGERNPEKEG